ncbi:MAG: exonuclease domain-containing protein [Pseudoclavibacter sp.]|jgi:DNA polymerase-3 subunit epsilon
MSDSAPASSPSVAPLPGWARRLAVFDTETTGVDTSRARLVSACIAVLDEQGQVVERRDWLADPGVEIPWQATRVHGITTERARAEGAPAAQVVAAVVAALRELFAAGTAVVAYNAPFDFTLLRHEAARLGISPLVNPSPIVDPLILDKEVDRYRKGKRTLSATCTRYGVQLESAHDSAADAIAAGRVAQAIAAAYPQQLAMSAQDLHTAQIGWARDQADSFADYMRNVRGRTDFVAGGSWPEH